jgi:D-tyrosyl-tRNA(Tyr) deacylase
LRALVQRVERARVTVSGEEVSSIGPGLLVLLGVARGDGPEQADRLAAKVTALRVFDDADGRTNEPLGDREILCVSQFTLHADTSRGNRPSYMAAAPGEEAEPLYARFCEASGARRGAFGRHMAIEMVADGPVTVMLEA